MEQVYIENEKLKIRINAYGAELSSIINKENQLEYLWNGDEKFWKRQSPVLFPFVGSLKNKRFIYEKKEYPMEQHGFARNMNFEVTLCEKERAIFLLKYTEETLKCYPFKFKLEIEYELKGVELLVKWRVYNVDDKEMFFSIGGHPAFMCPLEGATEEKYAIDFHTNSKITSSQIDMSNGLICKKDIEVELIEGKLLIDEHTFDQDAFIVEGNQTRKVSLAKKDGKAYLSLVFDTPLFGVWSPPRKNAPFVCIEPWYGRCDSIDFEGELKDREYGNKLEVGEIFQGGYKIILEEY